MMTTQFPSAVAIVVQDYHGHRLSYARLLIAEVLQHGAHPLLIAIRGTAVSDEYQLHLAALGSEITVVQLPSVTVSAVHDALPSDFTGPVVFLEGDPWLLSAACTRLPWKNQTTLLIMRPTGQSRSPLVRSAQSFAKAAIRGIARRRSGVRVFTLVSAAKPKPGRHEVRDPVTFIWNPGRAAAMRASWAADTASEEIYWFGIIGALGARKNIELVASSLASLDTPTVGLALLGPAIPDEDAIELWTSALRASSVRYFRDARQLSNGDFDAAIAALDCVVVAHSNEGPSGVLGKARAAGTRVIAAGAKSLRRDARFLPDIVSWVPLTGPALADALAAAAHTPAPLPASPKSESFACRLIGVSRHARGRRERATGA